MLRLLRSYITGSARIDHREDTKLAVDAEEQEALVERMRSGTAASTPSYHFICECFFLTAQGLHLGFVKTVQDTYNVARVCSLFAHAQSTGQSLERRQSNVVASVGMVKEGVYRPLCIPSCIPQRCWLVVVHAPCYGVSTLAIQVLAKASKMPLR